LAARVDELLSDLALATRMGKAGRQRVLQHFGWPAIAARTVALYDSLVR
jgi:starch synthase